MTKQMLYFANFLCERIGVILAASYTHDAWRKGCLATVKRFFKFWRLILGRKLGCSAFILSKISVDPTIRILLVERVQGRILRIVLEHTIIYLFIYFNSSRLLDLMIFFYSLQDGCLLKSGWVDFLRTWSCPYPYLYWHQMRPILQEHLVWSCNSRSCSPTCGDICRKRSEVCFGRRPLLRSVHLLDAPDWHNEGKASSLPQVTIIVGHRSKYALF